jgi:hypothetical protein
MRKLTCLPGLGAWACLALLAMAPGCAQAQAMPRVVLKDSAVLRTAPPSGPFNAVVGAPVQTLPRGTTVAVVGHKSYGAFDGHHVWLQVRAPGAAATAAPTWLYGGRQQGNEVLPSGVALPAR